MNNYLASFGPALANHLWQSNSLHCGRLAPDNPAAQRLSPSAIWPVAGRIH